MDFANNAKNQIFCYHKTRNLTTKEAKHLTLVLNCSWTTEQLGCSSVVQLLPDMHKALALIPSTEKQKDKKNQAKILLKK